MRLIDIDAFRKEQRMAEHCEDCERNPRECQYNDFSMMDFCGWLDDAPTVDAAPVAHGNWEEPQPEGVWLYDKRTYAQCSVCKKKSYLGWKDNYCRYCGAKMDLEEQDAKDET